MTANVKGLKLNVTVGVSVKANSIKTFEKRSRDEKDYHRFDTSTDEGTGINIEANAGIEMGFDSYEGEINLEELSNLIQTSLKDTIKNQVEEQLNGKKIVDDKTAEKAKKCIDRLEKMAE